MGCDVMGWDGIWCVGMGWDGIWCDGMGWDALRSRLFLCVQRVKICVTIS